LKVFTLLFIELLSHINFYCLIQLS